MLRPLVPALLSLGLAATLMAQDGLQPGSGAFPDLRGPYLGQKPPGREPELFAPGIVATGMDDLNAVFNSDGTEFYFTVKLPVRGRHVMVSMTQAGGRWSPPAVLPFSGRYNDADPAFSPDGRTLYFASSRPLSDDAPEKDWDIWAVDRTRAGWSPPRRLDAPVNSESMEVYPSVAANGTMYFSSGRPVGAGVGGIFRAASLDGRYSNATPFDEQIATEYGAGDVFIAPDEQMIVFSSGRPGGLGNSDLYVSIRRPNGTWGAPRNLGSAINSPFQEYCPSVSPDGKYFFFSSYKRAAPALVPPVTSFADILRAYAVPNNGNGDVYWVDAAVIR
jgi:Tol biopolymer transport system component